MMSILYKQKAVTMYVQRTEVVAYLPYFSGFYFTGTLLAGGFLLF